MNAYIRNNYSPTDDNAIQRYLSLVKKLLVAKRGNVELMCLNDLLNAELESLTKQCFDMMGSFSSALKDVSEGTRVLVAEIVGVIWAVGMPSLSDFNVQINEMFGLCIKNQIEHRHGCMLAFSHAIHRRIKFDKSINTSTWTEFKKAVVILIDHLNDQQPLLSIAAIKGISLISSVAVLPLPNTPTTAMDTSCDSEEKMCVDSDEAPTHTKSMLRDNILRLLRSAHSRPKIREEAAICLGCLAIGDGAYFTQGNLDAFIQMLKQTKDTALNIAIAQSIVSTVLGHNQMDDADSTADMTNPHCDDAMLNTFLTSIVAMVPDPSPASRNATAVWLLALVKHCSKRVPVYSNKQLLQHAFTELLSDDSDFVQDVSSRGLGLVFAMSDSSKQTDLANSLLNQLIGGKRHVNQVNADTQLFEDGFLGKTPTGYVLHSSSSRLSFI